MENEPVVVVLDGSLRVNDMIEVMKAIRAIPGVLAVKTVSKIVQEAILVSVTAEPVEA
jgi:nitrate reductase NapAB chaperone NapD